MYNKVEAKRRQPVGYLAIFVKTAKINMTLTQAAFWTKRVLLGLVILIIVGTVGKVGYDIWYQHYLASLPPVEEKPNLKFGVLPVIQFPNSSVSTSNFSYSLDTENGNLPKLPKIIKVYFIPQTSISLMSPDKANALAQSLGFFNGPQIVSQTEYHYSDNSTGLLAVNLPSGNFHFQRTASISAQPLTDTSSLQPQEPTVSPNQKDQMLTLFRNYLSDKNLLAGDLDGGRAVVIVRNWPTFPSQTFTISIWPSDFDNLPIITSSTQSSLIKGVLTNLPQESDRFLSIDYTHWPADKTTFATYPLKPVEQAFADLQSGLGFVSQQPHIPQVSISKVYLAYYQTPSYTPYLQPVFVFEGNDFQALVSAISTK